MARYRDRHLDGTLSEGEWHEIKLGLVGGWQDGQLVSPSYVAARETAMHFAPRLGTEAARRGALDIVGWRGLGSDGGGARKPCSGEWWSSATEPSGSGSTWLGCSAPNASKSWIGITAASICGSYRCGRARCWDAADCGWGRSRQVGDLGARFRDLLDLLAPLQAPTEDAGKVLATERGYFRANADRMHYPTYREQGLPIGSGAVESAAKHLVQQRMKRAGMRWSDLGARAILHLRCALQRNPAGHCGMIRDRSRLHPYWRVFSQFKPLAYDLGRRQLWPV